MPPQSQVAPSRPHRRRALIVTLITSGCLILGGCGPSFSSEGSQSATSDSSDALQSPAPLSAAPTAPSREELLNATLEMPESCRPKDGTLSFVDGQATLGSTGFVRIEEPTAAFVIDGRPTRVLSLACSGGGSGAFPRLAFYDADYRLVVEFNLSQLGGPDSFEPVVETLTDNGTSLHVTWRNEVLPGDTGGIHTGSGVGSADLTWDGSQFVISNQSVGPSPDAG